MKSKKLLSSLIALSIIAASSLALGTNVQAKSVENTTRINAVSASANTKAATTATTTTLTDGSSLALTASNGSPAIFNINTSDGDLRNITIFSDVPVKSYIRPQSTAYQSFINFYSGDYRMLNMMQWHFMPGLTYDLVVVPQSAGQVQVTAQMSKSTSGISWVNIGSNTLLNDSVVEKNILTGGQTEQFGIAIKAPGTYKINVQSASNSCTASIINSLNQKESIIRPIGNNSDVYTTITVPTAPAPTDTTQNNYVVALTSNDAVGTGAPYTVKITRIK